MKWRAFTVIELLVVISIIAFLLAISIPSLQNSRRQAKAALCGSNIKQLVLGLIAYETENGTFPYALDSTFKVRLRAIIRGILNMIEKDGGGLTISLITRRKILTKL